MQVVGQFLEDLFDQSLVKSMSLPHQTYSISHHFAQPLYSCPNYSLMELIGLILKVFSGIPETYQVLRCQDTTSEEELNLFLSRVEIHHAHYLVLNVNNLPFRLQEVCSEETVSLFLSLLSACNYNCTLDSGSIPLKNKRTNLL